MSENGGVPGKKKLAGLHRSEDVGAQESRTQDRQGIKPFSRIHNCDQSGMIRGYLYINYHSKLIFLPNSVCHFTVMAISVVDCSVCGKTNIIMNETEEEFDITKITPPSQCDIHMDHGTYHFFFETKRRLSVPLWMSVCASRR